MFLTIAHLENGEFTEACAWSWGFKVIGNFLLLAKIEHCTRGHDRPSYVNCGVRAMERPCNRLREA